MIYKLGLFLVITLCFSCSKTTTQKVTKSTVINTIPFRLTTHNNISIKAVLNKTDTVNLMFHTAANSITLTKEATKKTTSLHWNSKEEVKTWGGNATSRCSKNNNLEINNTNWDSIAIWENKNSGPTTDGKFGPNLFAGQVIEINFDNSEIIIREVLPEKHKNYIKTPLIFENESMFIEGISTIGSTKYLNRFLIHSGYGGTLLFDDKFVAQSKIGEKIKITSEKELKDSYGNVLKTKKGELPLFTIGTINYKNIPVGFFEGTIGKQQMSVLGGDLLKRFNILIDSKREFIYLSPNKLMNTDYSNN